MRLKFLLAIGAAGLAATSAGAAITVIGNSLARTCFETADNKAMPRSADVDVCDRALTDEALSQFDTVATFVNRGILFARRGETTNALADFDRASARDPAQPEAYFNKAAVLLRMGAPGQALPLFDAAIEHRTRFLAGAYFGRAIAQEELGNVRAAYQDFRRASEADPKWAEPRAELARFTVRRKQ